MLHSLNKLGWPHKCCEVLSKGGGRKRAGSWRLIRKQGWKELVQAHLPMQSVLSVSNYKVRGVSPGWGAQLVRVSSQYTKVVGLISGLGPYKKKPMNT